MTAMSRTLERRGGRSDDVLNLCFHGIGAPGRELEPDEEDYWIEPAQFEELLDVIVRFPSVRISFDDGNSSDTELALPALQRQNLTATFFILSGRLGLPGSLTAADVRGLALANMTVGSHGARHRPWRTMSARELHAELAGARRAIAEAAGQPVDQVACPFGSYDRRVLSAIRRHGFSRVYTVDGLPASSNAWLQARYSVRATDTPADIERRARSPREKTLSAAVQLGKSFVKRWR
jgi:peptidoglycan/xylan/chitin deacetylase (PgdA/CDA1 family)